VTQPTTYGSKTIGIIILQALSANGIVSPSVAGATTLTFRGGVDNNNKEIMIIEVSNTSSTDIKVISYSVSLDIIVKVIESLKAQLPDAYTHIE